MTVGVLWNIAGTRASDTAATIVCGASHLNVIDDNDNIEQTTMIILNKYEALCRYTAGNHTDHRAWKEMVCASRMLLLYMIYIVDIICVLLMMP